MLRVAVVGSGPSGVYTAQALVTQDRVPDVRVHVLDRLPCPYGLVRYGVAPDHEKIKSLQNSLRTVLEHERITFLGNVEVGGGGIPPERLGELYDAVVYCVGAATDRALAVPGEDLPGSCSATEFVSWYSAHPDAAADGFALRARSVVVIGVGNVAVDVARILARSAQELRPTDVPHGALGALAGSSVHEIHMAGRRGPSQARFTTKELRELSGLPQARVVVDEAELARDPAYADPSARVPAPSSPPNAPPPTAAARRNVEVLRGWAAAGDAGAGTGGHPVRTIHLRFFLRPVELLERHGRVAGVRFARTVPDGSGGVRDAGTYEDIPAQLVLRAIGYRGIPLPGLPFDPVRGTVPHLAGGAAGRGAVARGVRRRVDQAGADRGHRLEPVVREGDGGFAARRRPTARRARLGARSGGGATGVGAASGGVGRLAVHRAGGDGAGQVAGPGAGEDPGLGGAAECRAEWRPGRWVRLSVLAYALDLAVRRVEDTAEEPGEQRLQIVAPQAVHLGRASVDLLDDPALAQHPEVVRGRRLGHREIETGAGEFGLGCGQLADDAQPHRVGERVEHPFDTDLVPRGVVEHTAAGLGGAGGRGAGGGHDGSTSWDCSSLP